MNVDLTNLSKADAKVEFDFWFGRIPPYAYTSFGLDLIAGGTTYDKKSTNDRLRRMGRVVQS